MENHASSDSDSTDTESLSSDKDKTDDANSDKYRKKRDTPRCGNDGNGAPKIVWPPPSPSSNWRQLRHVQLGNPLYGTKMQLYSKTRHHLAVYPDGTVKGTPDDNDLHTYLELISAAHPGHVRIKGLITNLYVAMDKKGRLYGEPDMMADSTIFIETFQGSYNTYVSLKYAHLGWYIGIRKSGKFKKGPKTAYGQKAIMFLPRSWIMDCCNPEWNNPNMQLYCQRGYNLTIRSSGEVLGTAPEDDDPDTRLLVTSAGDVSFVRIQGVHSQLYLCFDSDGNLYGEVNPGVEGTVFEEHFQGSYTGFRSGMNPDWYVGIKKSGQAKNGNRTKFGQKAVKFLPRR